MSQLRLIFQNVILLVYKHITAQNSLLKSFIKSIGITDTQLMTEQSDPEVPQH